MKFVLICAAALFLATGGHVQAQKPIDGIAPHYGAGTMERVGARFCYSKERTRKHWPWAKNIVCKNQYPVGTCLISSPLYPIGTFVFVESKSLKHSELCQVVDQSAAAHKQGHINAKKFIEFSFADAKQFCKGLTKVGGKKPSECPIRLTRR